MFGTWEFGVKFRVSGLGFRVEGLGFRVEGCWGSGFGVFFLGAGDFGV